MADYCAGCGQKRAPLRQPVHHFVAESIVEYFGVDGRLWRSLGLLLFRPGRLTQAYVEGRRARYLRPLRLYLTATLLFFFLLSVLDPVERLGEAMMPDDAVLDSTVAVGARLATLDSVLAARAQREQRWVLQADSLRDALGTAATDSLGVVTGREGAAGALEALEAALDEVEGEIEDARDAASQRRLRRLVWERDLLATWPADSLVEPRRLEEAAEILFPDGGNDINVGLPAWMPTSGPVERLKEARTDEEGFVALMDYLRAALSQLPTVLFLLLPVFALLLKAVYVRRGWYYSEHLVFALHTHAFAFLVFAFLAVLLGVTGGTWWSLALAQVLLLVIPVYFFVAQKRVYGQGWIKTGVKAILLGWVYGGMILVMGLTLALVLAAIWG